MFYFDLIFLFNNYGDFFVLSSLMIIDSDFFVFEKGIVVFKLGKIIIDKGLVKWERLVLFILYV